MHHKNHKSFFHGWPLLIPGLFQVAITLLWAAENSPDSAFAGFCTSANMALPITYFIFLLI